MSTSPLLDSALAETGWLRRLARSLVKDAHRAEDAVQATLATALERREGRRSPRAWLAAILRNELRQERRARCRRAFHERRAVRVGSAPSAHDVNERLELQRLLLEALRALEEPYRSALVARFFDGLPPRAIARRDNLPVKTVNTHLERGLAKLRRRLDGKFGGERGAWLQAFLPLAAPAGVPGSVRRRAATTGRKPSQRPRTMRPWRRPGSGSSCIPGPRRAAWTSSATAACGSVDACRARTAAPSRRSRSAAGES
ncbi:MAG: sigma-70 family RNA polymerase sigma factor [Planctomycetes bacterium]|nr:sigma-70 family RNA polymerase sigma factor [Planctomycetota bacterium]